jgi:hypothetical protein
MINHARTLLLNREPDNVPYGGQPGDEFLPTNFVTVKSLPTYLRSLRSILLGSDPDRVFGNYRVRQYLALLHMTELVEFVTDLDPRITYLTDNDDLFAERTFRISASKDSIFINGELGPPDATGRSLHEWDIRILTSSTLAVTRHTKPKQHDVQNYSFTDGLSNLLDLIGSTATFRIADNGDTTWAVRGLARPQKDLGQILYELDHSGAAYMNQLFGVGTPSGAAEPFKTFRNLWVDHPELAYRLGGVLLAVIYRMEELRTNG